MNEIFTLAGTILNLLSKSEINTQSTLVALDIARVLYQNNQDKVKDTERTEWLEQFGLTLTTE